MDRSVAMERIPDGFRFPPDLQGRFLFDDTSRRLVFRGFMSKADFDRLSRLSDDWGYRRQLEELFRLCGPEETRPRGLRRLVSAVMGLGF